MTKIYPYTLAKKGKYRCPNCGHDKKFVRYVSTDTNEQLHDDCGKCDRSDSCGHHYTPKQYFADNAINKPFQYRVNVSYQTAKLLPKTQPSFIEKNTLISSLNQCENNNLIAYLNTLFDTEIVISIIDKYLIGTAKYWNGATVFWQIDIDKNIRTGKLFLYDSKTGKRNKEVNNTWAHKLGKNKLNDFSLVQCFFGEHLLTDTSKIVAIFESEKTAIIASVYFPEYLCIATGGKHGLNAEKCAILQGRTVLLFPDLSENKEVKKEPTAFELWSEKAKQFAHIADFYVCDTLENVATDSERKDGLDYADYLIQIPLSDFLAAKQTEPEPPTEPEPCEPQTPMQYFCSLPIGSFERLRMQFSDDTRFLQFLDNEITLNSDTVLPAFRGKLISLIQKQIA